MTGFVVEYEDRALRSTVRQDDPHIAEIERAFNEANRVFKCDIGMVTIVVGAQLGAAHSSIAYTQSGNIWVLMDANVGGAANQRLQLRSRANGGTQEDVNFARMLVVHEMAHNVYAPETFINLWAAYHLFVERQRFGTSIPSAVWDKARASYHFSDWNDMMTVFGGFGDVLVNMNVHRHFTPPPRWGLTMADGFTLLGEHAFGGVDISRPLPSQTHYRVLRPAHKAYLSWMRWAVFGDPLPPDGASFARRLTEFVDRNQPAKEWIDGFYPAFIDLMSEYKEDRFF